MINTLHFNEGASVALGDFSNQAEAYGRARPTYPDEIVDLLIHDAGVVAGDSVADFGAGTGIFTKLLVAKELSVTALEPNDAMRAQSDVPAAQWSNGTFNDSSLSSASQRWAVAAQAFHWADPSRALPEIRRVLQPNCLFTVLWNNRDNRESYVLSWTEVAIRRFVPEFEEAYRNRPWGEILESTGDFIFASHRVVKHAVRMDRNRYLDLWRSHNRLNTIAGPDRFSTLLKAIESFLDDHHIDAIDVPYRCEAWPGRRQID